MNDMAEIPDPEDLATYWKGHVEAWKGSGISQIKFCQASGLSYHRFVYWRRKFEGGGRRRRAASSGSGFTAVDYRSETSGGLTLSLPNGLVVRGICADNVPVVRQLLEQL
jgi:hypothetical protein